MLLATTILDEFLAFCPRVSSQKKMLAISNIATKYGVAVGSRIIDSVYKDIWNTVIVFPVSFPQ